MDAVCLVFHGSFCFSCIVSSDCIRPLSPVSPGIIPRLLRPSLPCGILDYTDYFICPTGKETVFIIVSASRRTDIPAFYPDWFFRRLEEGYLYVKNPMNPNQVSKILLNRDTVDCFVFWTKNPGI